MLQRLTAILLALFLLIPAAMAETKAGALTADYPDGTAIPENALVISLEEDAGFLSLCATQPVTRLVLDELRMEEDSATPMTFYTADAWEAGQPILLQAFLYDAYPRFRITFVNVQNEMERWYIDDSGEDGSLLLLSAADTEPWLNLQPTGLAETELQYAELAEKLQTADLTQTEYNELSKKLFELWEAQRILLWHGYAMSYAEQDWETEREVSAQEEAAQAEGGSMQPMLYWRAAAEATRQHVYQLLGMPEPASSPEN